jgi:hypothetical protein
MSGVLKAQLFELEKSAQTLERIIYKYLVELAFVPDEDVERFEEKILRKLRALDELQDEIDAIVAKLKEAGAYEVVSYAGNVYEYRPPKTAEDVVRPKRRGRPPKPKVSTRPKGRQTRPLRIPRAANITDSAYWSGARVLISRHGEFTARSLMEHNGQTIYGARNRIKIWMNAGLIVSDGKIPATYTSAN